MAGDARAQHGVVGADIGVVGRDIEAADEDEIDGVAGSGERKQAEHAHHDEFLRPPFRRGGIGRGWRRAAGFAAGGARASAGRAGFRPQRECEAALPDAASRAASPSLSAPERTNRAAWSLAAAIKASPLQSRGQAQPIGRAAPVRQQLSLTEPFGQHIFLRGRT